MLAVVICKGIVSGGGFSLELLGDTGDVTLLTNYIMTNIYAIRITSYNVCYTKLLRYDGDDGLQRINEIKEGFTKRLLFLREKSADLLV